MLSYLIEKKVVIGIIYDIVNDIGYGPKILRRLRYHLQQRLRYRLR